MSDTGKGILRHCDQLDRAWDKPGWPQTLLAIRLLIGGIGHTVSRTVDGAGLQIPRSGSTELIRDHMLRDQRWCIHQFHHLCREVCISTLLYLANLRRDTRPGRIHFWCQSHDRCVVNNINNDSFRPHHITTNCRCQSIRSPVGEMHKILRDGGIPVVRCRRNPARPPRLDYVRATPNARYAAISHLWADGLGDPSSHCLFLCQLETILDRIEKANRLFTTWSHWKPSALPKTHTIRPKVIYVWLDIFCVPLARDNTTSLSGSDLLHKVNMSVTVHSRRDRYDPRARWIAAWLGTTATFN